MSLNFASTFAFDTETELIGKGQVVPPIVCLSFKHLGAQQVLGGPELPDARNLLESTLKTSSIPVVGHELPYDLAVVMLKWPDLIPLIFEAGEAGRFFDTKQNEKLLKLSTTGFLGDLKLTLADLSLKYFNVDRSAEKNDPNSWRLRFHELKHLPATEYPKEAYDYALQDAIDAYRIFELQRAKATPAGPGSMNTASFQAAVSFALLLSTAHGCHTDPARVDLFEAKLLETLNDTNLDLLYRSGVLRRPEPPRLRNPKAVERGAEPKWTQPVEASVNTTELKALVQRLCLEAEIPVKKTDPTEKYPEGQISTDEEVLTELEGMDPVLDKYIERQEVIKLQTTYLPNLREGIVYPNYDVLKETGRTSSFKGKKGKQLYPSTNIQNQPRLTGDLSVRENYVARPGHLLCSIDYGALELCSFAQVVYWQFGYSSLRDLINEKVDPHAFLGAQALWMFEPAYQTAWAPLTTRERYQKFLLVKKEFPEIFKHYRTLAKPTGLGYPGGLGPKKFRTYAKATYGIDVTLEQATALRELWFLTHPEHKLYLQGINLDADPHNVECFAYTTPMGMYRAGATYCAAANGKGLQSPSAEGAKGAIWTATREMYDWTRESILFGCRMWAFIHDEIILELPDDSMTQARVDRLSEIMVNSMARIIKDVRISVEPALMRRWSKDAKPVYDERGRLVPWEMEKQAA